MARRDRKQSTISYEQVLPTCSHGALFHEKLCNRDTLVLLRRTPRSADECLSTTTYTCQNLHTIRSLQAFPCCSSCSDCTDAACTSALASWVVSKHSRLPSVSKSINKKNFQSGISTADRETAPPDNWRMRMCGPNLYSVSQSRLSTESASKHRVCNVSIALRHCALHRVHSSKTKWR